MTKKKATSNKPKSSALPPDQDQRNLILRELDRNLLVEAAAGTGKTASLVSRMVALLASGRCSSIHTLAAVTFTRKAAAELRSRFQVELEKAVREAEGERKVNLGKALLNIEKAFIGTIHSFCARLLRERPVEAEVDVAFEELDEESDGRLREEAWQEYLAGRLQEDREGIRARLDSLGLNLPDLEASFCQFVQYPDVEEWPLAEAGEKFEGLDEWVAQIQGYVDHMLGLSPRLPGQWGSDRLIRQYRRLPRIVSHYPDLRRSPDLRELAEHFQGNPKFTQKDWMQNHTFTREEAKVEQARWQQFQEEVVVPVLRDFGERSYGPILAVLIQARAVYDRLRRLRGKLNYQDLLLKAAALLRDRPHVRRYFQGRFSHLLVDEFQDTDPIQAEVMFLLTAGDCQEKDWRKCRPRPGALFVVGDPKQSIYRFRRADIVTYNLAKEIIQANGLVVSLSANFRTTRPIIEWVNHVFAFDPAHPGEPSGPRLRFPQTATDESPAYVGLEAARDDGNEGELSGVYVLRVPKEHGNQEQIAAYEADRIARFIRRALDTRMTVPRSQKELESGRQAPVEPSDFLIITPKRKHLSVYARALQDYGIPHQVTGGAALNLVNELKLLHAGLRAVVHPDDPVALLAALRSELFGISDASLYRFKKAGGSFSYHTPLPAGLGAEEAEAFADAWRRLEQYRGWLATLPPVVAVEKITGDLGLMAWAGRGPAGEMEAGGLCKALEILRGLEAEVWTSAQLVEQLGRLVEREQDYDGISVRSESAPAVRVLNLHKAKGLEAPVVFLADPSGESRHSVDLHLDRSADRVRGYLAIYSDNGKILRACPEDWERLEEIEERFLEAEALRLRYVAATRAGAALVISQRETRNQSNPWQYFAPDLASVKELPDPGETAAPARIGVELSDRAVSQAEKDIRARLTLAARPTFQAWRAKEYALALPREDQAPLEPAGGAQGPEATAPSPPAEGEHGVEWGAVLHQLLQLKMADPEADLARFGRPALLEHGLDAGQTEAAVETVQAVMRSSIWQRAMQSRKRLTEVPFALWREEEAGPVLLRGVIDLVFQEDDGWVLVDYKTDRVQGKRLESLAARYAAQVRLYAEAWRSCTGETVKETGLYFLPAGRWVPLPGAG